MATITKRKGKDGKTVYQARVRSSMRASMPTRRVPQSFLLLAAVAALSCIAAFVITSTDSSRADEQSELIEVDFGERGYLIPRRYINYFRLDPDGRSSIVDMHLLRPSLEPRSVETEHLWQVRDTLHHLRVTLHEQGTSSFDNMEFVMALGRADPALIDRPDGLLYREKNRRRAFSAEALGYSTPHGQPYVFFCNDFPPTPTKASKLSCFALRSTNSAMAPGSRSTSSKTTLPTGVGSTLPSAT